MEFAFGRDLVYKTQVINLRKLSKSYFTILKNLSKCSKNLYNVGLHATKQKYNDQRKLLRYNDLYHICKSNENYKLLVSNGQGTLRCVERAFKAYMVRLKKKSKKMNMPGYLPKDGHYQVIWSNNRFAIRDGKIRLSMAKEFKKQFNIQEDFLYFPLPPNIDKDKVKEITIIPSSKLMYFKMYIVYEEDQKEPDLDDQQYMSIDLGIDNLATCVTTLGTSFIMDGRKLKSINQKWNKEVARLRGISQRQKNKNYTKRLYRLTNKRNNRVNEFINQTINYIVKYCLEKRIGTIIIGDFKDLQRGANLGRRTNQTFCQIPYAKFKSKLESKCFSLSIKCIKQHEGYTSKCSFLDNEPIKEHKEYAGKRIKRGLFLTKNGTLVNADVNAACNIMSKYFKESKQKFAKRKQLCTGLINSPSRIRLKI